MRGVPAVCNGSATRGHWPTRFPSSFCRPHSLHVFKFRAPIAERCIDFRVGFVDCLLTKHLCAALVSREDEQTPLCCQSHTCCSLRIGFQMQWPCSWVRPWRRFRHSCLMCNQPLPPPYSCFSLYPAAHSLPCDSLPPGENTCSFSNCSTQPACIQNNIDEGCDHAWTHQTSSAFHQQLCITKIVLHSEPLKQPSVSRHTIVCVLLSYDSHTTCLAVGNPPDDRIMGLSPFCTTRFYHLNPSKRILDCYPLSVHTFVHTSSINLIFS